MTTTTPPPATPPLAGALAERRFVRALARSLVGRSDDADEIEQRTWLRALGTTGSVGAWRAWLARVVRNLARDQQRDDRRRTAHENTAARGEALPSTGEVVLRDEDHRAVVDAVRGLPEPYRSAVRRRYWDGESPAEIAARTGVPSATVRSQLRRGHALLRERLDRRYGDRRSWIALLVPLTRPPIGVTLMSTKSKALAAVTAIVVIAGLWTWSALPSTHDVPQPHAGLAAAPSIGGDEPAVAPAVADPTTGSPRVRSPAAPPTGGSAVSVVVEVRCDGSRVPGLPLTLASFAGFDPRVERSAEHHGVTDGDGTLEFALPTADDTRTIQLTSAGPDHRLVSDPVVVPAGATDAVVYATVTSLACTLRGTVRDARGRALAGATVSCRGWHETATDHDGHYALRVPRGEAVFVLAWADGFSRESERPSIPADAASWNLDFTLVPGEQLQGLVVDESGRAVEGARIQTSMQLFDDVRTNADGRFWLRSLDPGIALSVFASKRGYSTGRASWRKGVDDVEIVLARGVALTGRVLDDAGLPLTGVRVQVYVERSFGRIDVELTDADGRFRVPGVAPGAVTIVAHRRGYAKVSRSATADGTTEVELRLAPGHAIRGTVVDHAGEPLGGVRVYAQQGTGAARRPVGINTDSDHDGRFELVDLPDGPIQIYATESGYRRAHAADVVRDGTEVRLVLERRPSITGRVLDASTGEPVREFTIKISENPRVNGYWVDPQHFSTEDGRWTVQPDRLSSEQPVYVGVTAKGYAPAVAKSQTRVEPLPDACVVALQRGIEVRGRVRLLGDGTPVEGATIRLVDAQDDDMLVLDEGHHPTATSGPDGTFAFDSLGPTSTQAVITHADYPDRVQGPFELRDDLELELWVAPSVTASGRVVGFGADPSRVRVELVRYADGRLVGRERAVAIDGTFAFDGLGPGTHYLQLTTADGASRIWFVEVGTTDHPDLELRRREGDARVVVTVQGLAAGRIQLRPAHDARRSGSPAIRNERFSDGTFTFTGVGSGRYKVRVYDDGEQRAERLVELAEGAAEAAVTIVLD